jgi:hypothetical protein
MRTLLLLKTPPIDRVPHPPDAGKAGRRRGNQSIEEEEEERRRLGQKAEKFSVRAIFLFDQKSVVFSKKNEYGY